MAGANESDAGPLDAEIGKATTEPPSSGTSAWHVAAEALTRRPRVSLRFTIGLGFGFIFLLTLLTSGLWILNTFRLEEKLLFLEVAEKYLFEIQQARRFEKNFFLYGTNLVDALEHVHLAKQLLLANSAGLRKVIGPALDEVIPRVEKYEQLLEAIRRTTQTEAGTGAAVKAEIDEVDIRRHGAIMVVSATDLVSRERKAVNVMLDRARRAPIFAMVPLFLLMIYLSYFLAVRVIRPLGRFQRYTWRIGKGDFTPIKPARRYRDEFTDLAMATNHMLSELQRQQKLLVEAHKLRAVGTLTAGVAHELNNPINNILLTAHMLKEDYFDLTDDERIDMQEDIIIQADRCNHIVSQLLDFARETETKTRPLDLGALVEETVQLAHNQIRLADVELATEIAPDLPRVHGDPQQLTQVFLNLLINALEATASGGHIAIAVRVAENAAAVGVYVTDDGGGIAPDQLSLIFDPFFSTKRPKSKSHQNGGIGLGLSVSQGIVAKHGGRIEVDSVEGKGTTFAVLLPITTIPANLKNGMA